MIERLCDTLGVPFVAETGDGSVSVNAKARQALGSLAVTGLLQAMERMAETTVEPVSFMKQVRRAREGEYGEVPLGAERRILLMPAGQGRACAMLVEGGSLRTTTGVRRKVESDRTTAGMSHELANALGTITGWARLAKKGVRVEEALGLIEKAAATAWVIARQMHGHVETEPAREKPETDFSAFVGEAVRLLAPKATPPRKDGSAGSAAWVSRRAAGSSRPIVPMPQVLMQHPPTRG